MDKIKQNVPIKLPAWALVVIVFLATVGVFYFVSFVASGTDPYKLPANLLPTGANTDFQYGPQPVLRDPNYFASVKEHLIKEKTSFIEADLSQMQLTVYTDGEKSLQVPIKTKGREGSWWETPAGIYKIETREENHFSSFGHVYQPYSLAFQGNFFIHGWPYYEDGTEVPPSYSGGCIRLDTKDAEAVFDAARVGMPVLVFEEDFNEDDFVYTNRLPSVEADEYLVADLSNNYVFLSEGEDKTVPIASITKLMTAIVATEYINIEKEVVIPSTLASTSIPRLVPGETHTVYSLLYPLLLESSNEAADVIADSVGRRWFVDLMNKKAQAIGLEHTHFTDPSGADGGNVSTAEDLFRLAKYLYNNRSFILSVSVDKVGFNAYGDPSFANLQNLNDVPGFTYAFMKGGKVGKSTTAGETMLAVMEFPLQGETRPVAVIVLGSPDSKVDVRNLSGYMIMRYK